MASIVEKIRGMFWGFHAVMTKEWIEILNDKFTVAIILIIPIIQMTIYGFGVSFEVRQVPTVIFDQDLRPQSSILMDEMLATDFYKITKHVYSRDAAINEIVSGNARAAIIIPPNFSDKLQEGAPAQVQVLIDGSDSTIANALATTAIAVGQSRSLQILSTVLNQKQAKPPIDIRSRMLFNPDAKTTNFILPGLIGFMAQTITLFLTVNSVVRERVSGTLEQLMLTPVKPLGLMLGKLVPNGAIGFIGTNLMLSAMYLIFKVPINGNIFLLEACILIFVSCLCPSEF